ncbi:hypothetical protein D3C81_1637640 [compost metagenome]
MAGDVGITEVLDAEMIEIVQATTDRQILAPPVGVAFKRDTAPRIDLADSIRAAAQGGFITAAAGEIATLPPMLGEYRQGRDVQWQGAVFVVLEVEAHRQRRLHFDAFDVGKLGAITQAALGHQ